MIITAHVGDWVVWTDWVTRSLGEPEIPVLVPVRIEQVYQPAGQAGPVFQISTERTPAGQSMMNGFRHNALPLRWVGADDLSLLPQAWQDPHKSRQIAKAYHPRVYNPYDPLETGVGNVRPRNNHKKGACVPSHTSPEDQMGLDLIMDGHGEPQKALDEED